MNRINNIIKSFCVIASIVLFILSIPIIFIATNHQKDINEYLDNGISREVNIIDCEMQKDYSLFGNNYKLKVSYFTKPIFEGGEFKLHPILKFVNKKVFNKISGLKKTNIMYFKEKPEQSAILEASTEIENFCFYERQDIGIIMLILAVVFYSITRIYTISNKHSEQ